VLKVRRVYERVAGTWLNERIEIEDHEALSGSAAVVNLRAPRTNGLLIHPRPARVEVTSEFVHQEYRPVMEPYTEYELVPTTQSYACGTFEAPRTCFHYGTDSRPITHYRWVVRPVIVTDASCTGEIAIAPAVSGAYLVDYTVRE